MDQDEIDDRKDMERINKVRSDPPKTRYNVLFKNMTLVLRKEEYLDLISARNIIRKEIAYNRDILDAAQITDTEVYRYILTRASHKIVAEMEKNAINNAMKGKVMEQAGLMDPKNHQGHGCPLDPEDPSDDNPGSSIIPH